jgi:hypothetical protein
VSDFGDFDPLDEWDDGDKLVLKLQILERVVASLRTMEARRLEALRLVIKLEAEGEQSPRLQAIREALGG